VAVWFNERFASGANGNVVTTANTTATVVAPFSGSSNYPAGLTLSSEASISGPLSMKWDQGGPSSVVGQRERFGVWSGSTAGGSSAYASAYFRLSSLPTSGTSQALFFLTRNGGLGTLGFGALTMFGPSSTVAPFRLRLELYYNEATPDPNLLAFVTSGQINWFSELGAGVWCQVRWGSNRTSGTGPYGYAPWRNRAQLWVGSSKVIDLDVASLYEPSESSIGLDLAAGKYLSPTNGSNGVVLFDNLYGDDFTIMPTTPPLYGDPAASEWGVNRIAW